MTHASGSQDQPEARDPDFRGWFQPPARPPAAEEKGSRDGPAGGSCADTDGAAEPGDPEETAVFPRLPDSQTQADTSEPPAAPIQAFDDEPASAAQAPDAGPAPPELPRRNRPVDITRPQLILDDTMVDITGSRDGRGASQAGTAGRTPDAGAADGSEPDGPGAPDGKPKRS